MSGVAISRPSGPHSHVQNATEISSATCDTPAAPAYNTVSSTRLVNSSSAVNMPDHRQWAGPARKRGEADEDRRAGAEHGTKVWNESKRCSEHAPHQRVRHAEKVQSDVRRPTP